MKKYVIVMNQMKLLALFIIPLLLATSTYATAAGNVVCGQALDTAGALYTMNASSTINGQNCFNVTAANITIDCAGFSITGTNTSSTYGVYSNQSNTTIRNCNISNFGTGVFFNGVTYGTISNVNASTSLPFIDLDTGDDTTNGRGFLLSNTNYTTIVNSRGTAPISGSPIENGYSLTINNSNYNSINNFNGNGAMTIVSASNNILMNTSVTVSGIASNIPGFGVSFGGNNILRNITVISQTAIGVFISSSPNNTVSNSQIGGASGAAFYIYGNSQNSLIANNTINGLGGTYSLVAQRGNNTFINNTFMNATHLVVLGAAYSSNNLFYWNNFTATTGSYVQDLNGNNYYNKTVNGINQGNIYANVLNGSVQIGSTGASSSIAGYLVGDEGPGYPYNSITSNGKFNCNFAGCADYAPLTLVPPPVTGIGCPFPFAPVCGSDGVTYSNSTNAINANATIISCMSCTSYTAYMNSYNACAANLTSSYGQNSSYIERFIACSMGTLVGNSALGQPLLALIVGSFFLVFVMFQNTRWEGKIIILIPAAILVSVWVGWIMFFVISVVGIMIYLFLSKLINK